MQSLKHHFLLAMPHLDDANFESSLIYLCDHDDNGCMGVITNQPLDITLDALFDQLSLGGQDSEHRNTPVYFGGPTHKDRGFILHRGDSQEWDSSIQVSQDIALTTSMDMLQALANNTGPEDFIVCLGCSGWDLGQLEDEIKQNSWLTVDADPEVLFAYPPDERLSAAAGLLGVDLNLMISVPGHG